MLQSWGLQGVKHDWVTELSWTELQLSWWEQTQRRRISMLVQKTQVGDDGSDHGGDMGGWIVDILWRYSQQDFLIYEMKRKRRRQESMMTPRLLVWTQKGSAGIKDLGWLWVEQIYKRKSRVLFLMYWVEAVDWASLDFNREVYPWNCT